MYMKSNHCTSTKKSYANSSQGSQKKHKIDSGFDYKWRATKKGGMKMFAYHIVHTNFPDSWSW